MQAMLVEPNQK